MHGYHISTVRIRNDKIGRNFLSPSEMILNYWLIYYLPQFQVFSGATSSMYFVVQLFFENFKNYIDSSNLHAARPD